MRIVQIVKSWLPHSSFFRGVIVLGGGATVSQIISMAAAPLLTRMYNTEDFGIVAIFASMLSILSVVSSLSYEQAIPITKNDDEAIHNVVLALLVGVIISFFAFLGVIFFRRSIAELVKIPTMADYLWMLPIGLLLVSIYQVFYYWAIRVKAFSAITRTKLTQSISSLVVQLGGSSLGSVALIFGQVMGQSAGISSLATLGMGKHWHLFRNVRLRQVLWVAWRYRQFPYFSTWAGLLNRIGIQLPPILFAILFSPTAAGIYALAHRVLSVPMSLIGIAIGNVFLARATEAKREGNLNVLVATVHKKLVQIAMPPALLLAVTAPELFVWIFGSQWREAGVFVQLMVPMLYFQFILSPISTIFNVVEKQRQGMILQGVMVLARGFSLLIGAWFGNLRLAVTLFGLGSATSYLIFLIWTFKVSGNACSGIIKPTSQTFAIGLLQVTPLIMTNLFTSNTFVWLVSLTFTIFLIIARYFVLFRLAWK